MSQIFPCGTPKGANVVTCPAHGPTWACEKSVKASSEEAKAIPAPEPSRESTVKGGFRKTKEKHGDES